MRRAGVVRLVDANLNRALEGARVCEDIVRFHLGDPRALRAMRRLRHAIAEAGRRLPFSARDLAAARDSRRDAGRRSPAGRVDSLERLLLINLQRMKEALRALEECARLVAPRACRVFQRLRFRTYDLERDLVLRVASVRHR